MNQTVNKQLLDALKGLLEINDHPAPFSGKTGEERMLALENQAAKSHTAIHSARTAIAAAERAQKAEQVGDGESIDFPIAFLTTESGCGKYKLVLSFASLPDLHKGHDRILSAIKHCQPPAQQQAEPVQLKVAANNWPKQCPITRRDFFMEIDGVPTYGGPYDSYTIPEMTGQPDQPWHERELFVRRYDHDFGSWVEDEFIPLRVIHEDVLMELEDAAEAAKAEPAAPAVKESLTADRQAEPVAWFYSDNFDKQDNLYRRTTVRDVAEGFARQGRRVIAQYDAAQPPAVAVLQAELDEWRKLLDPHTLHVNLCRGFPAKLTAEQLLHIAGDEKQQQAVAAQKGGEA